MVQWSGLVTYFYHQAGLVETENSATWLERAGNATVLNRLCLHCRVDFY